MKSDEMKALCATMTGGNVSKFCNLFGLTRTAYYASINSDGVVHELTANKIQVKLYEMVASVERLDNLEKRIAALETK